MKKMTTHEHPNNILELLQYFEENDIPKTEYKKQFGLFMEQKARMHKVPLTGKFELTPFCNLDCKMCYVHLSESQYSKSNLLSFDQWKFIIDQARDMGMMNASLTGGECLTYPGFDDVYLYLLKRGVSTSILSNGILLDDTRIEFFKKNRPSAIHITVYGSSNSAYELVTGKRVFDIVYHNLIRMKDEHLPFDISITPSQFMLTDRHDLIRFVDSLDVPYNINANLIPPRENTGRSTSDLSISHYIELFKLQNELNGLSPINSDKDPIELPDIAPSNEHLYGLECGAGRSAFAIKYDGTMCPCLSLDELCSDPFEIGFSAAWKQINEFAASYSRPMECTNCIYKPSCLKCPAMHKNAPEKGHCDPRICERTKSFIQSGLIPFNT